MASPKKLGVVRELSPGEKRVAIAPNTVAKLIAGQWSVVVESGAGVNAGFSDQAYRDCGAEILLSASEVWAAADVVTKIRPPVEVAGELETKSMRPGGYLICQVFPVQNKELVQRLALQKINLLALDTVPRITRAQKMDTLSSMANIAGYRAVVEASQHFGRFFTGQITAAGKMPPAKVLIIGAGVAGLAALGAAKSLGAVVRAFDTRAAVKEQVESLGGEFLTITIEESGDGGGGYAKEMSKEFIDAEMALFRQQAKEVDIVITTALIPGKPAPKLWLADMVHSMRKGSVVVDLASERGGNCDLTVPDQVVDVDGVKIIGYTDMTSRMATVASELFGTNIWHLLEEMGGNDKFAIDSNNEVVRGALILENGEMRFPAPKVEPAAGAAKPVVVKVAIPTAPTSTTSSPAKSHGHGGGASTPMSPAVHQAINIGGLLFALLWLVLRFAAPDYMLSSPTFVGHLTVFVLAVFVGWQVVWNVAPALHTPLMSVTNAISGIIIVGGLMMGHSPDSSLSTAVLLAGFATLFATINIAGGFLVTRRMLAMFRK